MGRIEKDRILIDVDSGYDFTCLKSTKDFAIPLQDLLYSKQFCMFIVEPITQKIIFSSQSANSLYQYSSEEFSSLPFYVLDTAPWAQVCAMFSLSKLHRRKHFYATHRLKNEQLIYVEIFIGPIQIEEQVLFYVFIRNLTEKKQAEERIALSEKRYKALFANMKHPFSCQKIVINPINNRKNCIVIEANEQFASLLGLPLSQIIHQSFPSLISYLDPHPFNFEEILTMVIENQQYLTFEIKLNAISKVFCLTIYPTEKLHFATIFEDITAQRDLEILRNEYINTLTHEIRTPLASIKAGIELWFCNRDSNLPEIQNLPDIINKNIHRLHSLTNSVLDLQKLNSQKFGSDFSLQSINALIFDQINQMQPIIQEKPIKIEIELDQSIQLFYFNYEKISRVFQNLLSNAIKYTDKGFIRINSKKKDKWIEICIEDSGLGIKNEDLPFLFDTFFQSSTNKNKGSGLGLAIAKKIIDLHGGKIWVKSSLGKGASFFFTLPYNLDLSNIEGNIEGDICHAG
jgi:signal transduction histidine kinase